MASSHASTVPYFLFLRQVKVRASLAFHVILAEGSCGRSPWEGQWEGHVSFYWVEELGWKKDTLYVRIL